MPAESFSDARLDATIGELSTIFRKEFNVVDDKDVEWLLFSFAPGRVNYIGEHVDYMGGWVCPAAVEDGTHILVGRVSHFVKEDKGKPAVRFYATYNKEHCTVENFHAVAHTKAWTTFVRGALELRLNYLGLDLNAPQLRGICMVVHGTLTMGAGLSASAAFGVALLLAINSILLRDYVNPKQTLGRKYNILPRIAAKELIEVAKQGRKIETDFCGVNVGIMDQFSAALNEADKFLFLDCTNLTYKTLSLEPLLGNEYCWMLIDSMIKHDLMGDTGKFYNAVRSDQENGEKKISAQKCNNKPFTYSQLVRNPKQYTDMGNALKFMESCKDILTEGEYNRGMYQVAEQLRTLEFKRLNLPNLKMTREERIKRAGEILNEAHEGMKTLMKITTPELDYIQELINKDKDVAGGRMMGGGFGGCIILLLKKSAQDRVLANVQQKFKERFNVTNVHFRLPRAGCGAFVVSLNAPCNGKL